MAQPPQQPRMHLLQMLIHSASTHTLMSWADPADGQLQGLQDFAYWQNLARTLERGCFDGVFFADSPATHAVYQGSVEPSVRYGASWPNHDPMPLVAVMAAATRHLGIGVTLSTTGTTPYLATRRLTTLNHLSGGRVGWNIVTGFSHAEHLANGMDRQMPHDERYDYADEFMAICYQLWDSVPVDAILADKAGGRFADPARIRPVDFKGKYLSCKAVGPVLPSPHGRPMLFQAGSSGRGMQFALEHAEVVFAIQPHLAGMRRSMTQLKDAAASHGRGRDPKMLFGLQPIVRSTEAEARRRAEELAERIPLDAILARMCGVFGMDLAGVDPDRPLAEMETQASRGLLAATTTGADGKSVTLRDAAAKWALSVAIPQLIGTPEQVADEMERIWRETGCYGFNLSPTTNPDSVDDFVDHVVPLLQRRGIFRSAYEGRNFRENLMA
ncbi:MAG: NtaA/DmoA family FMN-dependent monooxygenase [Burkholderiales bacterium]|nr:NtaA/DmoA family FMN-dependent monooxygenase [Burkholderiales bacterium]MDE2453717.1 NtaA/DmoA family FMN-dependent monooxygenase [Burkholderiales bacterium]